MARIFVSHASADDKKVTDLSQWLVDNRFEDHFVDHIHIRGGEDWNDKLAEESASAEIVLPIVTENWLHSDECFNEYRAAYYAKKTVVPLFVLDKADDLTGVDAKRLQTLSYSVQGVQSLVIPAVGASETLLRGSLQLAERTIENRKRAKLIKQASIVASAFILVIAGLSLYFRDGLAAYWESLQIARSFDEIPSEQLGGRFIECASTDFCSYMVELPLGQYTMGASDEHMHNPEEWPPTLIAIENRIAVSETEITRSQWSKCAISTRLTSACQDIPMQEGQEDFPVASVSWLDVQEYIAWLNEQIVGTKYGPYRLLSEAEWEYSTRGVTNAQDPHRIFFWGDELEFDDPGVPDACDYANGRNREMPDNFVTLPSGLECPTNPEEVARARWSMSANAFGLYDTAGNVAEWVEDCWHDSYHQRPQSQEPWLSSVATSCERVLRGGSWFGDLDHLRSAARASLREDQFGFNIGFRLARDLDWSR